MAIGFSCFSHWPVAASRIFDGGSKPYQHGNDRNHDEQLDQVKPSHSGLERPEHLEWREKKSIRNDSSDRNNFVTNVQEILEIIFIVKAMCRRPLKIVVPRLPGSSGPATQEQLTNPSASRFLPVPLD